MRLFRKDSTKLNHGLLLAANRGDLESVNQFLDEGADLNARLAAGADLSLFQLEADAGGFIAPTGWTPLLFAAYRGRNAVVRELIRREADVNYVSPLRWSALLLAAERGHVVTVGFLLRCGADRSLRLANGSTALMIAASSGNLDLLTLLLDAGPLRPEEITAALQSAASGRRVEAARILLERGGDVNEPGPDDKTAFWWAAFHDEPELLRMFVKAGAEPRLDESAMLGQTRVLDRFLSQGADVNQVNQHGYTALMRAAERGRAEAVALLLEHDADVNFVGGNGWSAIVFAARNGHTEIVRELIKRNSDMHFQGGLALAEAAANGHLSALQLLTDEGAELGAVWGAAIFRAASAGHTACLKFLLGYTRRIAGWGRSITYALTGAAARGKVDCAAMLIDWGADPNALAQDGRNALMIAILESSGPEMMRLLLERGADPDILDERGRSALDIAMDAGNVDAVRCISDSATGANLPEAAIIGDLDLVRKLLKQGVDDRSREQLLNRALQYAVRGGHDAIVGALLDGGANANLTAFGGVPALLEAARVGNAETVRLLLQHGARPNACADNGFTALWPAVRGNHAEIVKLLLDAGIDPRIRDKHGNTALTVALAHGHYDFAKILRSVGVSD